MTVNQVSCCLLLNNLLCNGEEFKDVLSDTIIVAMDTVIEYVMIMDKKKKNILLTDEEKEFLNNIFYDNQELLIDLTYRIKALFNKRSYEITKFLKLFDNYDGSYEQKINIYKNLPFRYTNIKLESIILGRIFDIDYKEENYLMLISKLLDKKKDIDNFYRFIIFFDIEGLNYECFCDDCNINNNRFKVHCNNKIYSKNALVALLENFPNDFTVDYKQVIGQSAEMIVYENEISNLIKCGRSDLACRVIWVSQGVGDGFGYDILSFDPMSGAEKLIEVKGTLYYINSYEAILTKDEFEFGNSVSYDNDRQFYVYRVYIDRELIYHIKKIRCINGRWIDDDLNEYSVNPWYLDYFLKSGIDKYKIKKK